MLNIELTKDKFGETITVTSISGKSTSYAERNWSEYSKFCEYKALLGNDRKMTVDIVRA